MPHRNVLSIEDNKRLLLLLEWLASLVLVVDLCKEVVNFCVLSRLLLVLHVFNFCSDFIAALKICICAFQRFESVSEDEASHYVFHVWRTLRASSHLLLVVQVGL